MTDGYAPLPRRLLLVSLLALTGVALAGYLSWEFHGARASLLHEATCDLSATVSCTDVARTRFAEVLPGLPLSTLAGMFFAAVFAVAGLARRPALARPGARALQLLALLGVATSLVYLYIMHFRIGKYCLFCLGIDAVNVLLLIVASGLRPGWRGGDGAATWVRIALAGLIAAGAAWGGFSLLKGPAERGALASAPAPASGPLNPLTGQPMTPEPSAPEPAPTAVLPPGLFPAGMPADIRARMTASVLNSLDGPVETVGSGSEFPSDGPANAAITVVEFADFQCPHCAHAFAIFKTLRAKYGDSLRIVYRQYPLSKRCNPVLKDWDAQRASSAPEDFHAHACEEARLALCAGEQGRYDEAAAALYGGIDEVERTGPKALLTGLGLDEARLDACARAPKTAGRVAFDAEEGFRLGLHGTPVFFVNGRRLQAIPETLDFVIGRTLEKQRGAPR